VIVADVFGEQDRATALFQLSAAVMISELLAVPLGGALMTWSSPWVPFVLGLVILTAGIPLAAFLLPETLPEPSGRNQSRTVEEEDAEEDSSDVSFSARLRVLFSATRFVTQRNILLALAMFLASSLSRQSTSLLLQYSSTRYGWSIPQASLFLTVRGFVTLAVYLVLMLALSGILTATTGLSAIQKDRRMAQLSGIFSGAGLGMVALAAVPAWYVAGLVISALGAGFIVFARSLATQLVTPEQRSTLYAAVAVVQSVGALVAGPLLADLFRAGLTLGRDEMGLPFLFAGLLVGSAVGAVSAVRERENLPDEGDDAKRQALLGT
jgi:MFS family permease